MSALAFGTEAAREAAAAIRARLDLRAAPAAAITLGSGLGGLSNRIENARRVPFGEIPGFPVARVLGHEGALVAGDLGGREVLLLAGRFHMYEGHSAELAAFPVRVVHALGARVLVVSNAAGGVNRTFRPGDLMVIDDHVNLTFRNPLFGAVQPGDMRFPDMSEPYDPGLRSALREAARELGIPLQEGTYAWLTGPTYETPAEVRMLERVGADAVGMSTVPEVIVARAMRMRVLGVSCITNLACGLTPERITHAEVLETTALVAERFERLITELVRRL